MLRAKWDSETRNGILRPQSHVGRRRHPEGLLCPGFTAKSLAVRVSFTFQDLVDSDVSHELLHSIILQVAVAPMHL